MQVAEVAALTADDDAEDNDSSLQKASVAAHVLLLALCTEPSHGLAGSGAAEGAAADDGDSTTAAGTNLAGASIEQCHSQML